MTNISSRVWELQDELTRLQSALDALANEKTRTHWTRYLKGEQVFRGVPMGGVRQTVHAWWEAEGFSTLIPEDQKSIALRLFHEVPIEDRLAGVLALAEILRSHLSVEDLPSFAMLFEDGRIADWNLCDWFCVKVLSAMISDAEEPLCMATSITAWRESEPLWQRRAACVALVNHAPFGDEQVLGLTALILEVADSLVQDPARFAQTGVGWLIRELSEADEAAAIDFAERHLNELSREGLRYIVEKIPDLPRNRLLEMHTQLRRRGI